MAERTNIQPGFITSPIFGVGGQQTTFYPFADPQKCEALSNIELTERGTADRRYGYGKYNSNQITEAAAAKAITGLLQQKFTNATTRNFVIAGTKIYAADTTTAWASLDVTGTAEVANSSDARIRTAFIDNQVFGTCGTVRPWVVGASGNAAVLASSIPFAQASGDFCKDFVVHRNVLVALNTKEVFLKHRRHVPPVLPLAQKQTVFRHAQIPPHSVSSLEKLSNLSIQQFAHCQQVQLVFSLPCRLSRWGA